MTIIRTLPSPTTVTPRKVKMLVIVTYGFLYDKQGHIITNNHAIGDTKIIKLLLKMVIDVLQKL